MEILGIGLPEIGFVVLLALIILGPKDMIKAGQTLGRSLRKFIMSPTWKAMQTTGREIQQLPTKLMREAGLEELKEVEKEVQSAAEKLNSSRIFDENQIFAGTSAPKTVPESGQGTVPESGQGTVPEPSRGTVTPSNEPESAPDDSPKPPQ